jgi:hypothetical protein
MNTFALELLLDSMMLTAGQMHGMLSLEALLNSSLITMGTLLQGILWMGVHSFVGALYFRYLVRVAAYVPLQLPGLDSDIWLPPLLLDLGTL